MKALRFERNVPRFAAATIAGRLAGGAGAKVGPLRLRSIDPPELPGPGWVEVLPRLAGICGSDLSTIDGHSSRYFEQIVSFPFVPGHEVVADLPEATPPVTCPPAGSSSSPCWAASPAAIDPVCDACARGDLGNCEHIAFGAIEPGLQTGFCCDTGGGWSTRMVAHTSQLHAVPADWTDEAAVMVEPTACAVHGALAARCPARSAGGGPRLRRPRPAHHRRPAPLRPRLHDPRRGQAPPPAFDGQGARRRLGRRAGRGRPGRAAGIGQPRARRR